MIYWRLQLASTLLAATTGLLGCVPTQQQPAVVLVPTRTAGVAFVIVRPSVRERAGTSQRVQAANGKRIGPNSQYVLLCDGRAADGMHCELPVEAAVERYSYTPRTGRAAAPIDQGVGTLADISTHLSKDRAAEGRSDMEPGESGEEPPPPPDAGDSDAPDQGSRIDSPPAAAGSGEPSGGQP